MLDIRPIADAGDYRDIRLAALRNAPEAFGSTYETEAARPLAEFETRMRSAPVFGAYRDGQIVGMAGFGQEQGRKDRHKGYLWGMYVHVAARRQGVGNALVAALLAHAAPLVEQVRLTVVTSNVAAIALYARFGFVAYGIEPRALKEETGYADEMLMVCFCPAVARPA